MASHPDFVQYVVDQLAGAGIIHTKRMFGEYGLYLDGLFFAVICDDPLFLKPAPEGCAAFAHLPMVPPYEGAKAYLLFADIDNRAALTAAAHLTCTALQKQLPRRPKKT